MSGIFKAYDIRGIYNDTLTDALARDIGRAFATFTEARTVVIGRDMRPHSEPLFEALAAGLTRQGANVIDVGLCSTPMCYFACGSLEAEASIMITASHNPGEWNGFKLTRDRAIPISGDTGIRDIERICNDKNFAPEPAEAGRVTRRAIGDAYAEHVRAHAAVRRPLKVAADMANAMGTVEAEALKGLIEIDPLFDTLDGSFPNHEANPLKTETLDTLRAKVRAGGYDFGIAFDGDADRVGFVDEQGDVVPMDLVGALIAKDMLRREKGVILYDLRCSRAVREVIEENGGTPMKSRVGHAFIKQQMRDHNGLYCGEFSGHFYFRDNYYTESSALAALSVANIVSAAGRPLSELIKPIRRYAQSGEINSRVRDPESVMKRIQETYRDGEPSFLDGITVDYEDWWFNVRASNTEPLIRLNVEARTREQMETQRDALLELIRA
ncbi:MAG: phosphomannomutase/phosphoglucomutase [Lentisphaerae bacterium]|nr:phosphomannomutase/phosphoglucomutase [Lentisphaerota bacterium]